MYLGRRLLYENAIMEIPRDSFSVSVNYRAGSITYMAGMLYGSQFLIILSCGQLNHNPQFVNLKKYFFISFKNR
jgi:hypothetical protein